MCDLRFRVHAASKPTCRVAEKRVSGTTLIRVIVQAVSRDSVRQRTYKRGLLPYSSRNTVMRSRCLQTHRVAAHPNNSGLPRPRILFAAPCAVDWVYQQDVTKPGEPDA